MVTKFSRITTNCLSFEGDVHVPAETRAPRDTPINFAARPWGRMRPRGAWTSPKRLVILNYNVADVTAMAKVTRAAYRYGPVAGRIMARRFSHLLSDQDHVEINRILNLGPPH